MAFLDKKDFYRLCGIINPDADTWGVKAEI
jgi:hypothetical protein